MNTTSISHSAPGDRRPLATARFVPQNRLDRQGFETGDFWFGRTLSGQPFGWREDLNLLTCAGPRAGKGVSVVVPNLVTFPGSAVVIDPKGELASLTAAYRRDKLGQKVVVLDPARVAEVPEDLRGTFNPLAQLREEDPGVVAAAQTIASGIVVPNPNSKDPFFDQTALSFIQALILYLLDAYEPDKRTLMTLRQTASVGNWDTYEKFLRLMREGPEGHPEQGIPEYQGSPNMAFEMLLDAMFSSSAFNGILREEAAKISQMGEATRGNVLGTVRTHLDFLREMRLESVLKSEGPDGNELHLSDLRDQKQFTTVYICLPVDMMYQQGRWMRLVVMQICQYIQRTKFNKETDQPVLMLMDEFYQLGPIPTIENTLTYAPGFGLRLWLVVQDIGQLKANYPKTWETIMGACGIKQFFGVNDLQTAKYVSELIGEEEVDVPSVTFTQSTSYSQGRNTSDSHGVNTAHSNSSNWSNSFGSSGGYGKMGLNASSNSSYSYGGGSSSSYGENQSRSSGSSESETAGDSWGYTVNKQTRRVLRPEEILTSFSKDNLLQLLHVRDKGGMLLFRTPYYLDPHFQIAFDFSGVP